MSEVPTHAEAAPGVRRPWWRRLLVRLALLCTSLLVFLGLCEVVLRIAGAQPKTATALLGYFEYHERIGWWGRPDAGQQFQAAEADVWISHNADGLRTSSLDTSIRNDPADARTVWCLGDSTTWGWGVTDGETWVDELNRLAEGQRLFRNLGATGYSALQEFLLLREHLQAGRKPHEVVVLFCSNDVAENLERKKTRPYLEVLGGEAVLRNETVKPGLGRNLTAWLTTNSLVCNYVHYYFMRARRAMRQGERAPQDAAPAAGDPKPGAASPAPPAPPPVDLASPGQVALLASYARIRDICNEYGLELHVVTPYAAPDLAAVCAQLGLRLTDLSPYWQEQAALSDAPTQLLPDPHWNALGNTVVGRAIHTELFEAGR